MGSLSLVARAHGHVRRVGNPAEERVGSEDVPDALEGPAGPDSRVAATTRAGATTTTMEEVKKEEEEGGGGGEVKEEARMRRR
eukprot:5776556-Pyramimonas_sp.AAC.1